MRRVVLTALFAAAGLPVWAADTPKPATTTATVNPDEIIQKFAAKEAEFARARENYMYRQTVRILELDDGGNPRGKYELTEDVIFSPDGKRTE